MNNIEKDLIKARAQGVPVYTFYFNGIEVCDINNVRYVSYGKCISGTALKSKNFLFKENDLIGVYSINRSKALRLIRLDALLQPILMKFIETRTPPASGGFREFDTGREVLKVLDGASIIKLDAKYCFNVAKSVLDLASGVGADYNKADKDVRGKYSYREDVGNENTQVLEDKQPSLMDLVKQIESMGWIVTLARNHNQ